MVKKLPTLEFPSRSKDVEKKGGVALLDLGETCSVAGEAGLPSALSSGAPSGTSSGATSARSVTAGSVMSWDAVRVLGLGAVDGDSGSKYRRASASSSGGRGSCLSIEY